jgi:hypothetical protein
MSPQWAELRAAIDRLNFLFKQLAALRAEVASLKQQLRDARGG